VEILNISLCQTGSGILIVTIGPIKNIFNVKGLKNGKRWNVRLKGGQIGYYLLNKVIQ